ncbi:MAG: hypothetical protein ACOCPO_04900 [Desulfohalobiaceae bacterium]
MQIMHRVSHELQGAAFMLRNLLACRRFRIKSMPKAQCRGLTIQGASWTNLGNIQKLHQELRQGRRLNPWRLGMLAMVGGRICTVAVDKNLQVAGLQLLYFREQEWLQGVIHEAFIGICSEHRAQGTATCLRLHAARHLEQNSYVRGISSQVQTTNTASLRSARKAGFVIQAEQKPQTAQSGPIAQLYLDLRSIGHA